MIAPVAFRCGRCFFVALLTTTMMMVGCGNGEKLARFEVSGQVRLAGKDLDQGTIEFRPEGSGRDKVGSGTTIKAGKYAIPKEKGLPPGKYDVLVFSAAVTGPPPAEELPGESNVVYPERIPAEFNTSTTLKFEVKASGTNTFNVDVPNEVRRLTSGEAQSPDAPPQ